MKFNQFSLRAPGPGPRSVNPPKSMRSIPKLNRSKHLPPVKSYAEASSRHLNDVRKALSEDAKP
jgi:hypothetical protein